MSFKRTNNIFTSVILLNQIAKISIFIWEMLMNTLKHYFRNYFLKHFIENVKIIKFLLIIFYILHDSSIKIFLL